MMIFALMMLVLSAEDERHCNCYLAGYDRAAVEILPKPGPSCTSVGVSSLILSVEGDC